MCHVLGAESPRPETWILSHENQDPRVQRPATPSRLESHRHRPLDAGEHADVVEFLDDAAEAHPVRRVEDVEVDDQESAARLGVAPAQVLLQGQVLPGAVLSPVRKTDHGEATDEAETAGEAGTEDERLEGALLEVHAAEEATP